MSKSYYDLCDRLVCDKNAVHPIGCVCESCSATYEREATDPRALLAKIEGA